MKLLDECFCDDGRELPECEKCLSNHKLYESLLPVSDVQVGAMGG